MGTIFLLRFQVEFYVSGVILCFICHFHVNILRFIRYKNCFRYPSHKKKSRLAILRLVSLTVLTFLFRSLDRAHRTDTTVNHRTVYIVLKPHLKALYKY